MATIVEFTIPADDFPLGRIFESLPTATVEIDRIVPTNRTILPYFWVRDADADRIEDALTGESAFESVRLMDDLGDEGLFCAEWNHEVEGVLTGILEADLTIISAVGSAENWIFEFRAESTDQISEFQQYCAGHDIGATLTRLKSLAEMQAGDEYGLTANQQEALLLAFEKGYYDDPRETDLQTLADRLEISRTAFADRLRRGTKNVFASTIAHHIGGDDEGESEDDE